MRGLDLLLPVLLAVSAVASPQAYARRKNAVRAPEASPEPCRSNAECIARGMNPIKPRYLYRGDRAHKRADVSNPVITTTAMTTPSTTPMTTPSTTPTTTASTTAVTTTATTTASTTAATTTSSFNLDQYCQANPEAEQCICYYSAGFCDRKRQVGSAELFGAHSYSPIGQSESLHIAKGGYYAINVVGAQGGGSNGGATDASVGGRGMSMTASVWLKSGETLIFYVGAPGNTSSLNVGGGGGGGSYVYAGETLLLAAGGGGGASQTRAGIDAPFLGDEDDESGSGGMGHSNGQMTFALAGPGAGHLGDGAASEGAEGKSRLNGFEGGVSADGNSGGYGGGGAGSEFSGGGGGGFRGGDAGLTVNGVGSPGEGGSSFVIASRGGYDTLDVSFAESTVVAGFITITKV